MFSSNVSRITTLMIYIGTLLISILSFFTTLKGLNIILSWELALRGSLGLQTAMLGIAWNLIKIKDNRGSYVLAFCIAAVFSIFFSYANFDTNLKANTRPREVRNAYFEDAKPVLTEYSIMAKKAVQAARYQVNRIASLIDMEEEKGWATIVDEGSRDNFIQSIIDGARLTVESWKKSTGAEYRQGRGRGIIINYLESRQTQARYNLEQIIDYAEYVDSLAYKMHTDMPVSEQYNVVNKAYINFPAGVVSLIHLDSDDTSITPPLAVVDFAEKPANTQQALMLVIGDLLHMDRLTFLALMLAIAIDFIVILIAFAGSHIVAKSDFILERIEGDAERRLKEAELDDVDNFNKILEGNLIIYKKAAQYGKDISRISEDYQLAKNKFQPPGKTRPEINKYADSSRKPIIIKEKSRLEKWLRFSRSHK